MLLVKKTLRLFLFSAFLNLGWHQPLHIAMQLLHTDTESLGGLHVFRHADTPFPSGNDE
jgi:hypothetical protein